MIVQERTERSALHSSDCIFLLLFFRLGVGRQCDKMGMQERTDAPCHERFLEIILDLSRFGPTEVGLREQWDRLLSLQALASLLSLGSYRCGRSRTPDLERLNLLVVGSPLPQKARP